MRRLARLALVVAYFLSMPAPAAADPALAAHELPSLRESAQQAYRERDIERALARYEKLTTADPDYAEGWFGLSRAYEWSGDLENAIAAAEQAQALGYLFRADLAYRIARLHAEAGNRDEALHWIEQALDAGYGDRPAIQHDDAFRDFHGDAVFRHLAGMLPATITSRDDGLRFDIGYLVEEVQRMHADLERAAYSGEFIERAEELRTNVPKLADAEVHIELSRLLALIGDGHTGIYGPDPDTPLDLNPASLPLRFYWFDEGLFVIDGKDEWKGLSGSRVVRIGGLDAQTVLERLSELYGGDNPMSWKWIGPQFYLGRLELLGWAGATDSADSIELTLADDAGETTVVPVPVGPYEFRRKLRPSPAMTVEPPLYLSQVDTPFWMQPLEGTDTLYVQFNQVRNAEDQSISEFAGELAAELGTGRFASVIVDVRHNNGGNNMLLKPLVQALIAFDQASDDHELFVITGRNTFSAAQNFIARVERWTDAIFVGEPSSSRPNFVGEETSLLLPWSRIRGSISNLYWQESDPIDHRRWIAPAIPVAPRADDYFAGRDVALAQILAYLGQPE